jgi:hypothetical protein
VTPSSLFALGTNLQRLGPSEVVSITTRFGLHSSSFKDSFRKSGKSFSGIAVLGLKDANDSLELGARRRREGCVGSRTPGMEPLIESLTSLLWPEGILEGPAVGGDMYHHPGEYVYFTRSATRLVFVLMVAL